MNWKIYLMGLYCFMIVFIGGCSGMAPSFLNYSPSLCPDTPLENTAVIIARDVFISSLDDWSRRVWGWPWQFQVCPGKHRVGYGYCGDGYVSESVFTDIEAVAGHVYIFYVKGISIRNRTVGFGMDTLSFDNYIQELRGRKGALKQLPEFWADIVKPLLDVNAKPTTTAP